MSRHAPLYGSGLEALSMKELDTISHIHEEGLRQIRAVQQCKGYQASTPLVSGAAKFLTLVNFFKKTNLCSVIHNIGKVSFSIFFT